MSATVWRVRHRTSYTYAAPARDSFNEARLMPVSNDHQTVRSFDLTVTPATPLHSYKDFCGNVVHHFDLMAPHGSLAVEACSVVEVHPRRALPEETKSARLDNPGEWMSEVECYDYLSASRYVSLEPEIWRLAIDATMERGEVWAAALGIMRFVHGWLTYAPTSTTVHTTAMEVLGARRGVCQDFAHLMLGMCRSLKIPARYVSGYLATEKASATHAWVEVYVPGFGWQALDPTHNQIIDQNYIKIGAGRDYADVAPVTGYYKGSLDRKMEVEVEIRP